MSLRKKFVNSTLTNKTCPDCGKSYPRTEDYFYKTEHRTKKGSFSYSTYCITCQLERGKKWRKNNNGTKKIFIKSKKLKRGKTRKKRLKDTRS